MAVIKDLGAVTAYASAVEGGYTGTKEEFATLMASYATVAEEAADSAESASASATSASASAQTATTKASEASASASTAGTKASEASASATTASSKASEASASATSAQTAQGLAESARDDAIDAKTDAESARDMAQQYAESINPENIFSAYATDTASGSVASFADGADDIPMKSVVVNIEPVQSGSGDPSPDNVRPISGWTGANVVRAGKNLFDAQTFADEHGLTFSGDTLSGEASPSVLNWVLWENTSAYTGQIVISGLFSAETISNHTLAIIIMYTDGTKNTWYPWDGRTSKVSAPNKTVAAVGCTYGTIGAWSVSKLQIELGSTATAYEPYTGDTYSITFPTEAGTVYGGELDVTNGVLTVDRVIVDMGSLSWAMNSGRGGYFWVDLPLRKIGSDVASSIYPYNGYRPATYTGSSIGIYEETTSSDRYIDIYDPSYSDVATLITAITGQQLVYELATPVTYTLTPTEIKSLLGDNNIWADAGNTEIAYRADTKLYIEKKMAGTDIPMVADSNIVSGSYFMIGDNLYKATANIASGAAVVVGTNATAKTMAEALNEINA